MTFVKKSIKKGNAESLEYIKTKVNVDEFIEFLILYFNTILKKYDKNNEKS